MTGNSAALLLLATVTVGVLHTAVPDHWAPIALVARQKGWSKGQTARAAAIAGLGHTVSTLIIALIVWVGGATLAVRFGRVVNLLSSLALIGFGAWLAASSWRELRGKQRAAQGHYGHAHAHRHGDGLEHRHWHAHDESDWHAAASSGAAALPHRHEHSVSSRTSLLLILGSSPMLECIPLFFAAGRFGTGLLVAMGALFSVSTIATYVVLCLISASGMERLNLRGLEEYGEVLSGLFIAALGLVFLLR